MSKGYHNQSQKRGYSNIKYSSNSYGNQRLQQSKFQDKQEQKLILDQHYSNNIMMTVLSTLQSLEASIGNTRLQRENKMFGYYDKIRFDDKSYLELKSQLQTQLTLLKASRQVFEMENPKSKYVFSNSFNEYDVLHQIERFKNSFRDDKDVLRMCNDFSKIVQGSFKEEMSFERQKYTVKYSEAQTAKHKKDILHRGIRATQDMNSEQEMIQKLKVKHQSQLPVQVKKGGQIGKIKNSKIHK